MSDLSTGDRAFATFMLVLLSLVSLFVLAILISSFVAAPVGTLIVVAIFMTIVLGAWKAAPAIVRYLDTH